MQRFLVTALLVCLSTSVFAAPVTFTDRPTFNAHAPGLPVEDFVESRAPTGGILNIDAPLDATSSNAAFLPGEILSGLQLADQPGPSTDGLVATGDGLLPTVGKAILTSTLADSLNLNFAGGVGAVGFELWTAVTRGATTTVPTTIEVFDVSNTSLGVFPVVTSSSGSVFFGVIADSALIGRINILASANQAEVVDNIAFGAVVPTAIPEPSTSLLFATGLAGLLGYGYRRRQRAA